MKYRKEVSSNNHPSEFKYLQGGILVRWDVTEEIENDINNKNEKVFYKYKEMLINTKTNENQLNNYFANLKKCNELFSKASGNQVKINDKDLLNMKEENNKLLIQIYKLPDKFNNIINNFKKIKMNK